MRSLTLFALTIVVTVGAAQVRGPAPDPAERSAPRSTFIVVYDPGPIWRHGKPASEQPGVRDHGRYLLQLYTEGTMQSAGPLADGGGVVIFHAEDEDAARAVVDADPAVISGLMEVNMLRRWEPRDWEQYVRR